MTAATADTLVGALDRLKGGTRTAVRRRPAPLYEPVGEAPPLNRPNRRAVTSPISRTPTPAAMA